MGFDFAFVVIQLLNGLTNAMFIFLIASGLWIIFGVLGVLNFAHGSFYMLGAYMAYQCAALFVDSPNRFWWAVILASITVALLGGVVERFLLRRLYHREELSQLLFTYALVLILGDMAKIVWGVDQLSVSRPAVLRGAVEIFGQYFPKYNVFILIIGPCVAFIFWFCMLRTRWGRMIRAAALDRETLGALGVNVNRLFMVVFMVGSYLAALGGGIGCAGLHDQPRHGYGNHHQCLYCRGDWRFGQLLGYIFRCSDYRNCLLYGHSRFSKAIHYIYLRNYGYCIDSSSLGPFGKTPAK